MHTCRLSFVESMEIRVTWQDVLVSFYTQPSAPTQAGLTWAYEGTRRKRSSQPKLVLVGK